MKRYLGAVFLNTFSVLLWRLIAGGLLFYASLDKIKNPDDFFFAIKAYKMLPLFTIGPFAWLMPRVELVFGAFLVLGLAMRASAPVCGGLYAVFTVAIVQALLRGLNLQDCGCGIIPGEPVSWFLVLRDLILLAMCAFAFFAHSDRLTLDRFLSRKEQD
jgi:uncharacterized membrane protein YphA (DoxX/SURF4 family)